MIEHMFDSDLSDLDADATLTFASSARALADRAEVRLIEAAAHWADLHGVVEDSEAGRSSLPGTEQLTRLGGDGTPELAEFAPAELGAELSVSAHAAARLIGDALDLRHRLPRLWARVMAGEVKPWIGRKTADITRNLSLEAAAMVDRRVAPWAHGLSWGRLESIIEAACIEADPETAQAAAESAARSQGVWIGRSNDHGIKDIHIRTEAPHAIWFDASVDRIADSLRLLGDESTKDIRRARAVGVIAQPQRTLDLYEQAAATDALGFGGSQAAALDDSVQGDKSPITGAFVATRRVDSQPAADASRRVDPRPPATLYVHLAAETVAGDAVGSAGRVARLEGVGVVTAEQVKSWLGGCEVTVKSVIDLADQVPVDGYEVPDRLREAVHLRSPVDVFPYASSTSRNKDVDHTEPYLHPDEGGPPGQTSLANLGPMTRFHHRIKTHGRWLVRQPFPGIFVWRSPHGRHYLVDHGGTHRIHKTAA